MAVERNENCEIVGSWKLEVGRKSSKFILGLRKIDFELFTDNVY